MQHEPDDREFGIMLGCADKARWLIGLVLLGLVLLALATCAARYI